VADLLALTHVLTNLSGSTTMVRLSVLKSVLLDGSLVPTLVVLLSVFPSAQETLVYTSQSKIAVNVNALLVPHSIPLVRSPPVSPTVNLKSLIGLKPMITASALVNALMDGCHISILMVSSNVNSSVPALNQFGSLILVFLNVLLDGKHSSNMVPKNARNSVLITRSSGLKGLKISALKFALLVGKLLPINGELLSVSKNALELTTSGMLSMMYVFVIAQVVGVLTSSTSSNTAENHVIHLSTTGVRLVVRTALKVWSQARTLMTLTVVFPSVPETTTSTTLLNPSADVNAQLVLSQAP